ncbi:YhcN/YlaJ family sporulation lipoprotein [Bacillus sp. ISL-40]|uniref:YhcN/YlaJ family sporulation lipoprotein n=1 Tax=unclassified Bacillus (in: firmicutes) TaxID=185979 RepID=UPI001BEC1907|nr:MULTISPECIES: YhcN/YlaJ family sporulation lipoprotein [unclassified Bacillus (in: firmicutes)]MBT2701290.1 YhcN/YlaJ family sporulation lipoprotein [Bacillus sp. ISL-40]MBT2724965.1 YhcN/YlaJ family sporulation lipoprotein [Bacillus sp. ISL-46]MBT2743255.1 YhcN/YlaJ family sporulation lipoprotein [Bacillus sp. ISL-77]
MKKLVIILGLCTMTALTGCTKDMGNRDVYEESGNTINVNNKRHDLYNEGASRGVRNVSNNYGFVRHQKSPLMNDNTANDHFTALNREQVANIISKYSTEIPNVNDVATLVTDQEVLIAYDTDSKDRNLTADQVKKTAMSVVPRYYHVFVTDNKVLMRDVENLANLDSTSRNARNLVNGLIKQMKKSPQGQRMNASEDENGLTPDDIMGRNNK